MMGHMIRVTSECKIDLTNYISELADSIHGNKDNYEVIVNKKCDI